MDIKEQIRAKFTEATPPRKSPLKWSRDTQPNAYKVDDFLQKSGYRLVDVLEHMRDGVASYELVIEPKVDSYLYPEITHHIEDDKFYINVKKWGELEASDVEEIIKGYETALGVIRHLATLDLTDITMHEE